MSLPSSNEVPSDKHKKSDIEPFAVSFNDACTMAGHERDYGYAKCKSGRWESYIDAGKRMVTIRSIKADIERCIAEQGGTFTPAPFRGQPEHPKRRPRKAIAAPASAAEGVTP